MKHHQVTPHHGKGDVHKMYVEWYYPRKWYWEVDWTDEAGEFLIELPSHGYFTRSGARRAMRRSVLKTMKANAKP